MPRGKQRDDDEGRNPKGANGCCCGSIDRDGGIVVFLNCLSFVAGVAMIGLGGLLIYNAVEKGAHMSADRWIITIYSVLMGILVVASSGVCRALRADCHQWLSLVLASD